MCVRMSLFCTRYKVVTPFCFCSARRREGGRQNRSRMARTPPPPGVRQLDGLRDETVEGDHGVVQARWPAVPPAKAVQVYPLRASAAAGGVSRADQRVPRGKGERACVRIPGPSILLRNSCSLFLLVSLRRCSPGSSLEDSGIV